MSKPTKLVYTTDPEEARHLRESGFMPPARDSAPEGQTIRVTIDRKSRKGKTVTIASGFQLTLDSLEKVARLLKQRCAAGGSVKEGEVEIQGDHASTIAQALTSLGYRVKRS